MTINWYPGHMAKTRRAMAKAFPSQDVVIEVLDARMPYASSNPVVTALRKQKPCIKLLTKADLADPEVTQAWLRYFAQPGDAAKSSEPSGRIVAIASSAERFNETKSKLQELCKLLTVRPNNPLRPVRAIVVGIPNVGKSTLINLLMGRKVAKVGDEPAVTKSQQQVTLPNGVLISDNPGLLWPRISDPKVGLRLAFGGAISEAAIDYEPVARYAAELLLERYPQLLIARYKLKQLPASGEELLTEIGRRRGCLRSGGVVDLHKASDVLIHDFRGGILGRISLETPEDAALGSELNDENNDELEPSDDELEPLDDEDNDAADDTESSHEPD
jgi:ribosome biogenesis GTPase A